MKVKEYRFHIPIYHIFWELQCAEITECIAVSKLLGLDPDPLWHVWRHPSYGQVGSPSSTETPECLPDIHEGPLNLAKSNGKGQHFPSLPNWNILREDCIKVGNLNP
jgi:hypothetical protein